MEEKFFKDFNIQTLTPVHIGCGTEEKLKKDIDFIIENEKIGLIDWDKILTDPNNRIGVTSALVEGNTEKIREIAISRQAIIKTNISINSSEITKNLKNKLTGKPIIPGSSTKGAVTSVLLEYFTRDSKERKNLIEKTEKILGSATEGNHFMRFLQFTDAEFTENSIFETKVFNLRDLTTGGWKHGMRIGTIKNFSDRGFTFAYETIPPGSISTIFIGLNEPAFKLSQKINLEEKKQILQKVKDKQNKIFDNKILELFRIINEHTKNYILKEKEFYNNIINKAQFQDELLKEWENLMKETQLAIDSGNRYCILRVGFSAGFHSITGDWWFETHLIDSIDHNQRNRGKFKGCYSAKSRKFIFEKQNGKYIFYPFGFVKIGDFEPEKPSQNKKIRHINMNNKIQNTIPPVEEKKPYEPQYKPINKLKEGDPVEAVVTESKPPMIYFKVFVEELKDYTYSLKYPAGIDVGTYCLIKLTFINKKDYSKHNFSFIRKI